MHPVPKTGHFVKKCKAKHITPKYLQHLNIHPSEPFTQTCTEETCVFIVKALNVSLLPSKQHQAFGRSISFQINGQVCPTFLKVFPCVQ